MIIYYILTVSTSHQLIPGPVNNHITEPDNLIRLDFTTYIIISHYLPVEAAFIYLFLICLLEKVASVNPIELSHTDLNGTDCHRQDEKVIY